ncbi:MAG: caspase family protein, partial [Anaerolineales bacterium]|nr:caspase family protein [Anaerolineales bacterium]
MVLDTLPRISIIAIGVERYENMRPLFGPSSDIKNIRSMLTVMPDTALFNDSQFIEVLNPSSAELRQQITNYVLGRSASGDILIFYFSGHGIALGSMDFGFCTVDTNIHPGAGSVLPFTLVKFSEIMASLS